MEKHKEKLVQREREIEGLRLQMAKLSKIIDKQKDEIKSLQKQLRLVEKALCNSTALNWNFHSSTIKISLPLSATEKV